MQKLAEICVRRPVFATMLILSITVVGLFSFRSLGVDLFPKIDLPTITITVVNPGASPQEIETEITDKVEGAVNTISGIDELRSTSVEGVSQVFVNFVLEKNADVAASEIRNKVDLIVPHREAFATACATRAVSAPFLPNTPNRGPALRSSGSSARTRCSHPRLSSNSTATLVR